jgi:hypothetical protein
MDKDFLIVDNHISNNGDITTEFKECDGKILIKHFSGLNCENFIVKKYNGKKLDFSIFRLNGVYYVTLNGQHIIDYKRFINVQYICNEGDDVKLRNSCFGEIIIKNCDAEVVQKAMVLMASEMKKRSSLFNDILYYIFH